MKTRKLVSQQEVSTDEEVDMRMTATDSRDDDSQQVDSLAIHQP